MQMKFGDMLIKQEKLLWELPKQEKAIIFWGCGNSMRLIKKELQERGVVPTAYCENNPNIIGKSIDNVPVLSYDEVRAQYKEYIIVLTVAINNAVPIVEQLKKAGEKNPIYHIEHPFKVENVFLEYSDVKDKFHEYEKMFDILQDERSKKIFQELINFKISGNKLPLLKYVDGDTFFDENIIPESDHYSYMDVGAYTGDTLLRFYAFCRGKYNKLYAVEPDEGNFKALSELVKYGRIFDTHLFQVGGWNYRGELTFYTITNNATNFDSPNFFKNMENTVYNSCELSKEIYDKQVVAVDTVDNLLNGEQCDVIKINALGADYQVLLGCENTIRKYHPVLVGEFGAQKEHLLHLLEKMKEMNSHYKIYLRQKEIFGDCKTVFFAVDD